MARSLRNFLSLDALCREAAAKFGDDWRKIDSYVKERLAALTWEEREALLQDATEILRFTPPRGPLP